MTAVEHLIRVFANLLFRSEKLQFLDTVKLFSATFIIQFKVGKVVVTPVKF